MSEANKPFVYRLAGTAAGNRPGAHRSHRRGAGMSFAAHARLFDQPDPRRLDLRASITSVTGDWLVQTYMQRSSIQVSAIVDVSESMRFGSPEKLQVVIDFLKALGLSASGYGDSVSLLAFDATCRTDLYVPPRTGRGMGLVMASTIASSKSGTAGAGSGRALADTIDQIKGQSGLVFILSDFHWSLEEMRSTLDKLGIAMVVPIVIWDDTERLPPSSGHWLSARDSETGQIKRLWLRRGVREQWISRMEQRTMELEQVFVQNDAEPFFTNGSFDSEDLSRYFLEKVA